MLLASLDPLSPFLSLLGFTLWYRFLLFLIFFFLMLSVVSHVITVKEILGFSSLFY